ncbi:MAG TPA: hypothetical protein DC042_04740 [Bacteroidales bacterium]|nr:hypothetical protein [Bacteroidales bacterium]
MSLVYFIRLILKNTGLILGVAVAMSIIVMMVTGNQPKSYTSSTVIYTGIATGYDLESGESKRFDFYATNAQFDNLINIIKSREIQEETGIRLMAQHLMLSQPDPGVCSAETWHALMNEVPIEVKNLVVFAQGSDEYTPPVESPNLTTAANSIADSANLQAETVLERVVTTEFETRTDTIKVTRYTESPRQYTVKAGDYPAAIAKRYGLTLEQLDGLNPGLTYPITGGQRLNVGSGSHSYKVDSVVTHTIPVEKVTWVPKTTPAQKEGSGMEYERRMDSLNATFRQTVQRVIQMDPYEKTVANLRKYKEKDQTNYIYKTLQSSNPIYSVQKISSVKVVRIQSSDMLRLTYDSHDQAVCMNTLKIITKVFSEKNQNITAFQTNLVSDFFREKVELTKIRLDSLEGKLLEFNSENRIINYNEQTKFIAEQKETLDKEWSLAYGNLSAGKAALQVIEENLDEKARLFIQNTDILERRRQLHEVSTLIATEEIKAELSPDVISGLKAEAEKIKSGLSEAVKSSYQAERTKDGINIKEVLTAWFQKVIAVEEARAIYEVLTDRKARFLKKYDEFAPLGSRMRQLEREIDLAQQDYMNHLHNLNLSIMKQKNVEQSDVQVLDEPIFPIKSNPSKRMFSVIAAFLAGLIITAALIILLEFLDTSIKFPERFSELTGLPLLGAFPKLPGRPDPKIDYNLITSRSIDQICQKIRLEELKQKNRGDQPFIVFILSTRDQEGKTFLGSRITEKLRVTGSKVLFIKPQESRNPDDFQNQFQRFGTGSDAWDFEYEVPDNFLIIRNINELLRNFTFLTKGYQFIFIELPALLANEYPASMVNSGNLSIVIGRASRTWNRADEEILKLYANNINHPMLALLDGCGIDNIETIIGEIPKRRSVIRKLIKKIINLDLKGIRTY